ncbi:MAG: hypothetical protein JXR37_22365 [Kiritimatiellae bacterium]|nr:hypothetical protein [Kiritimatiellia bacterium]
MTTMKLRPHHVLDIITSYGHGQKFKPHPYGHAVHTVAEAILADPDLTAQFVVGADEICRPCVHLQSDGRCDDVLSQLDPPISKQTYNDELDSRLFEYLGMTVNGVMTVREYLQIAANHMPGLAKVCTHPKQDEQARLDGLRKGLQKLGISPSV